MTTAISFEVQLGVGRQARATYLPYGTRTLAIDVLNQTGQPLKLWLRPDSTPDDYPAQQIYGFGGDRQSPDTDLLVHWAGGDEVGACVKMDEKSPLRDRSLAVWQVVPVALGLGESQRVYLNITHLTGPAGPRRLTLAAVTSGEDTMTGSQLELALVPPEMTTSEPVVRGVWRSRNRLVFEGAQVPEYVSRWWPSEPITYRDGAGLPDRLSLHLDGRNISLQLDAGPAGQGRVLAEIEDLEWKRDPQEVHQLRPLIPELFHLCDDRFYVARLWFLWLDKRIGKRHEVPDAERIDVLFDLQSQNVRYMGTDFHYHETWGELLEEAPYGQASLGLTLRNVDDFGRTLLSGILESQEGNPITAIQEDLCLHMGLRQTGRYAHVPLLRNVRLWERLTSVDVRTL